MSMTGDAKSLASPLAATNRCKRAQRSTPLALAQSLAIVRLQSRVQTDMRNTALSRRPFLEHIASACMEVRPGLETLRQKNMNMPRGF